MKNQVIALFLVAATCGAQTPVAAPAGFSDPSAQEPAVPDPYAGAINVSIGTTIPLTLVSSIKSKSTKPGDSLRAVVAFPITVGEQLAIPAGTYVEGIVNSVTLHDRHTHLPSVQIHFTRLLFANGYTVQLDAANTESFLILPEAIPEATAEVADARYGAPVLGEGFAVLGQTPPVLPPLPPLKNPGPNPAVIFGATLGGTALLIALGMIFGNHHGISDYVIYDNGWQFQMVLQSPLILDAQKVAVAAATPAT